MTVSRRIPWRNVLTCCASAGPGDQHRGGRPGQVEGVRNHRPGDQRPDVYVVLYFGSRVDFIFISKIEGVGQNAALGLPAQKKLQVGPTGSGPYRD